jgi:hypothetical protein
MKLHVLTTVKHILLHIFNISVNSQCRLAPELCKVPVPVFKEYYVRSNLHSLYMFRIYTLH